MKHLMQAALAALCLAAPASLAQTGPKMTHDQLVMVTSKGVVLNLGGAGEGYAGKLTLRRNGTASGSARTDAGQKIQITGTWAVRDGMFCRVWADLDGGKEVCETWYLTSERSVEAYNGTQRLGANSW